MNSKNTISFCLILSCMLLLHSCVEMFKEDCTVSNQIEFVYLNADGRDETDLYISNATDYIFDADSILYRVDRHSNAPSIFSRAPELPDGNWYLLSFANLSANSRVAEYTIGQTHMNDLFVDVISKDLYKMDDPNYIGDSDNIYFSALPLVMRNGRLEHQTTAYYTPAHARLTVFVTWADQIEQPKLSENSTAILQSVSGGCSFLSYVKTEKVYDFRYAIPALLQTEKIQHALLYASDDACRFDAVSMRYEKGKAPHIQLMNGAESLTSPLDLNLFFDANNIDLSSMRIQNFRLAIRIEKEKIVISPIDILAWDVEYI